MLTSQIQYKTCCTDGPHLCLQKEHSSLRCPLYFASTPLSHNFSQTACSSGKSRTLFSYQRHGKIAIHKRSLHASKQTSKWVLLAFVDARRRTQCGRGGSDVSAAAVSPPQPDPPPERRVCFASHSPHSKNKYCPFAAEFKSDQFTNCRLFKYSPSAREMTLHAFIHVRSFQTIFQRKITKISRQSWHNEQPLRFHVSPVILVLFHKFAARPIHPARLDKRQNVR